MLYDIYIHMILLDPAQHREAGIGDDRRPGVRHLMIIILIMLVVVVVVVVVVIIIILLS